MEINKLYVEDCMETMQKMSNNFVDISITSPPYNLSTDRIYKYDGVYKDSLDQDDYFVWQKNIIQELMRVTKNYVFYNVQMVSGNKEALWKLIGYFSKNLKEVLIWDKIHAEPAISDKVLNSQFEFVLVFAKNGADKRYFDKGNFRRGSLSNVIREGKNTKLRNKIEGHGAIFPLNIPGFFVKNFSRAGELVYDPFMGSGTTALAAMILGRNWVGSEISANYAKQCNDRIQAQQSQGQLF